MQGIAELPAEVRALFRTAWELPQRALIDLAAARGAVHRPEPVAQPVHGRADHRQALLDVPARLEERPEDHLLPALPPGHPDPAGHRHRRGDPPARQPTPDAASPAPWRTPRPARPASDHHHQRPPPPAAPAPAARPRHGPDPAADALPAVLRPVPRRHQEHLDGRGGRPALGPAPTWPGCRRPSGTWSPGWSRSSPPATRSWPTTSCSTSTSTSTRPRARLYLSRQLFEEAVHVQFYLTLLDTYVPDETRAARGVRRRREHPLDRAQGRVLLQVDRLGPRAARAADRATTGARSCST